MAEAADAAGGGTGAWPACSACGKGTLLPLSDYGRDGATITYKAWVCSNPDCGFIVRYDNGDIGYHRSPAAPS